MVRRFPQAEPVHRRLVMAPREGTHMQIGLVRAQDDVVGGQYEIEVDGIVAAYVSASDDGRIRIRPNQGWGWKATWAPDGSVLLSQKA
jgi:hypothetical protein